MYGNDYTNGKVRAIKNCVKERTFCEKNLFISSLYTVLQIVKWFINGFMAFKVDQSAPGICALSSEYN